MILREADGKFVCVGGCLCVGVCVRERKDYRLAVEGSTHTPPLAADPLGKQTMCFCKIWIFFKFTVLYLF